MPAPTGLPAPASSAPQPVKGRHRPVHGLNWHVRAPSTGPTRLAIKNHFIAMVGEYVGTTLFLLFALGGTNVANIPTTSVTGATQSGQDGSTASVANTSNLLYIALCFGFSLAVNAWIFFRVSGGLFNPAVSLGMLLVGALTPLRAALLTISQILGGITGAALVQALLPGTLNVRTLLAPGVSVARGLFLEMFLTAMLMLTIFLLAAEKHKATFLAPIGIGLALFIAELFGVYYTGGSLNPARSFGPSVVLHDFSGYHWIYWVGPALGATLAAGFYKFIKFLEYETVLGPEDSENRPAVPPQLSAPSATLLGSTAAGPSSDTPFPTEATTSMGEKPVPVAEQTGTADVQGPGLADLLTTGPSQAVYSLPQPPISYDSRLDRIEALLEQLVHTRHAGAAVDVRKVSTEGTEGTLFEDEGPDGHSWRRKDPSPV
ncbi:uncharacterized protein JCM10292_007038 [Rhodotorula paludigena]|uniref:uncharacterized protein n=1 Tax=Rhodotorula paludigena TaxID=86838 RepID=UPI00317D33F7